MEVEAKILEEEEEEEAEDLKKVLPNFVLIVINLTTSWIRAIISTIFLLICNEIQLGQNALRILAKKPLSIILTPLIMLMERKNFAMHQQILTKSKAVRALMSYFLKTKNKR
ncbi:hypothetical protein HN51_027350 [Arachis hypogaea]